MIHIIVIIMIIIGDDKTHPKQVVDKVVKA